jgi:hypothetical protein
MGRSKSLDEESGRSKLGTPRRPRPSAPMARESRPEQSRTVQSVDAKSMWTKKVSGGQGRDDAGTQAANHRRKKALASVSGFCESVIVQIALSQRFSF